MLIYYDIFFKIFTNHIEWDAIQYCSDKSEVVLGIVKVSCVIVVPQPRCRRCREGNLDRGFLTTRGLLRPSLRGIC